MNNTFNKEKFADLIMKAKGTRSLTKYGEACGISPAHLSRLTRCMKNNAPSPTTLRKMASQADNNVTFEDFMSACGHTIGGLAKYSIEELLDEVTKRVKAGIIK